MGAAIGVVIVSAASVSVSLLSRIGAPEWDFAAQCAGFVTNQTARDHRALKFLVEQRNAHERLGNADMVVQIDEHLVVWEAKREERHAKIWAQYEEACLPEPKPHLRPVLVL